MTTNQPQGHIDEAEITGFAAKLDAWARDLTPAEQTQLHRLVSRAAAADPEPEDTQGYIVIHGAEKRAIIVIGGQPSPLLLSGLGLSSRAAEGGGGVGLSGRALDGGGGVGRL